MPKALTVSNFASLDGVSDLNLAKPQPESNTTSERVPNRALRLPFSTVPFYPYRVDDGIVRVSDMGDQVSHIAQWIVSVS